VLAELVEIWKDNGVACVEALAWRGGPHIIRLIKSRRLSWAEHVVRMGEIRGAYRVLVGKREGRRPLGRPRRRCEDNIKMYLREVGWGAWTGSILLKTGTWWALVNAVMNRRVP
jgi:hypothetical protein